MSPRPVLENSSAAGLIIGFAYVGLLLYFHPLAKYPGPFLAKITSWYDIYHCYKKDKTYDQLRCQQRYGPIFRYAPNFLVVNTAEGLRDIYTSNKTANIRKGPQYKFLHHQGSVSTLSAIDKDVHLAKRRMLSPCFNESSTRELEPLMITTIKQWIQELGAGATAESEGWSSPKDMAQWANYLTFDVLGNLCFGTPFGLIHSTELRSAPETMLARTRFLAVIAASPISSTFNLLSTYLPLDRLLSPQAVSDVKKFHDFSTTAMRQRQSDMKDLEKPPRKDFVYFLTRAIDSGWTELDFMQEMHLLIIAGSDTIAITIAACFYYLSRDADVLANLQSELRATFDSIDEIVPGTQLASCAYLRAVIKETLRIAPPAGVPLQREIIRDGLIVDGKRLPGGTLVGTATYALHHSPEYFNEPEEFRPERWLPECTSVGELERGKSAFAPFSIGTRSCIGERLAYKELNLALARVLYVYDIRLEPGDTTGERADGLYDLRDVFIAERWGPKIQFRQHGN